MQRVMGGLPATDRSIRSATARTYRAKKSPCVWKAGARLAAILVFVLAYAHLCAQQKNKIFSVPSELRSDHFRVTINGSPVPIAHAAANYYYLNFDLAGPTVITVTAPTANYWAKGVEVQPWRLGIRPALHGRTIMFTLTRPAKISITRPNDHLAGAEMLFLFANLPEAHPPNKSTPGIRYYGPGVYHQNIDAYSGDSIYLAGGAVVFGSLNIWGVRDVKVFGRGTLVYDGPQDPNADEGWIHRRNWHGIVMDHANNIEISGITCIVRSRTWMVQMKDSRHIAFENVKIIGGSAGNANQDGMDWLGGGDTAVRDSFIRAADDVFAMYGNWDGYSEAALTKPGDEVSNITIEDSVLSTSISNIVRVGWPKKIFDSRNFILRNSDVIHMGMGACGIPFALFEIWANSGGKGIHSNYLFDNIRLEDWYSLAQLTQRDPAIKNVEFKNIWAIETPSMVASAIHGDVSDVSLQQVNVAGRTIKNNSDLPMLIGGGALNPRYLSSPGNLRAAFTYHPGTITPHELVSLDASTSSAGTGKIKTYLWSFGDGTTAVGRIVHHAFPDAEGTLWDHTGRFRVLLTISDADGHSTSTYQPVVVTTWLHPSVKAGAMRQGLSYKYYEGIGNDLKNASHLSEARSGVANDLTLNVAARSEDYRLIFHGYLRIPNDGGYTFQLESSGSSHVEIDSVPVLVSPPAQPQVCGSAGNAIQPSTGSIGLRAGLHRIRIVAEHTTGSHAFTLLWQAEGIPLSKVPAQAFQH